MSKCEHKYGEKYCPLCGVKLNTKEKPKFPLITSVYLHSSKDSMWEKGEEIGLTEEAIRENFQGCCYEVEISITVNKDGTYTILNCDG